MLLRSLRSHARGFHGAALGRLPIDSRQRTSTSCTVITASARALFDGASYGPDALMAMGQAFDEAWTSIAGNFGHDPQEIESARLRLATALLSVASEDSRDVEALKRGALEAMALGYRERPALTPETR